MDKKKVSKKLEKLNEKIKLGNEEFKKMSAPQKRVAIAKDVLASLKTKKYKTAYKTYCALSLKKNASLNLGSHELQNIISGDAIETCNVCAMGGVFLSKVNIGNNFKVKIESCDWNTPLEELNNILNNDEMIVKSMKGIFTEKQLRLIEYAFEGEDITSMFDDKPYSFHDKMTDFFNSFENADDRLVAIMKNIVKNEGEFKI